MRRASHEEFNLRASEKYQPLQFKEAALNLLDILKGPETWVDRLKQFSSALPSMQRVFTRALGLLPRASSPRCTDGRESQPKTSQLSLEFTLTPPA